jgi:hypothetical protein
MPYEPRHLNQRHHRLVDLYLRGCGRQEMSRQTGLAVSTISRVTNSQRFLAEVDTRRQQQGEIIQRALEALQAEEDPEKADALRRLLWIVGVLTPADFPGAGTMAGRESEAPTPTTRVNP